MKVSDYLRQDFCLMNLKVQSKEEVIRTIAAPLYSAGKIKDLNKFVDDVLEREVLGSTGIGHGIALPHARTSSVEGFVIGFGRSIDGIEFKSIDSQKVNLIFLMGSDIKELNLYLRLLAELSKLLMNNAFRRELLAAAASADIINIIKKFEQGA
jgi:fructose-specific phosphotransferase system IIA component